MKMWEIRQNEEYSYPRHSYRDPRESREPKDMEGDEYNEGFEEGYRRAMKEMSHMRNMR